MKEFQKEEKLHKLHSLAMSSGQSLQPKRAFLGWKCPECGGKLDKETVLAWGEVSEFANKVISEAGLPKSTYALQIDHFTCECGYEFAKQTIESLSGAG